ncbi:hypothetical protein ACQR1Y_12480 [Bradyrhizobium sp. HKCCYLRH3099]|uniref:hypothetical protein n=1 Tax=Bradyrhizobium TaxID=374 RepID=UPI003EB89FA7
MTYSDHPEIDYGVTLMMAWFGAHPFEMAAVNVAPPLTRDEIVAAVHEHYGDVAAATLRIAVH